MNQTLLATLCATLFLTACGDKAPADDHAGAKPAAVPPTPTRRKRKDHRFHRAANSPNSCLVVGGSQLPPI
jgi:hypothetical protein